MLEKIALALQNIQDYDREKDNSLLREANKRIIKIRRPRLRIFGRSIISQITLANEKSAFAEELTVLFDGLEESLRRVSFHIERKESGDLEKASTFIMRLAYVLMHPKIATLYTFIDESTKLEAPKPRPQKQGIRLTKVTETRVGQLTFAIFGGLALTVFGAFVFSEFAGQPVLDILHSNPIQLMLAWAAICVGLLTWLSRGK